MSMGKIKRCKSRAPIHDMRCDKDRGHELKELDVVHQNGMIVWRDDNSHYHLDRSPVGAGPRRLLLDKLVSDAAWSAEASASSRRLLDQLRKSAWSSETRLFDVNRPRPVPYLFNTTSAPPSTAEEAPEVVHSMCVEACGPDCDAPVSPSMAVADPQQQLTDWWMGLAATEVERTVPKAIEYSATDLTDIGRDLARTMGREVGDEEAAELGVFFYLRGKVARWVGAVMNGTRVSDDTLFDIGVYVRMAQRIRHSGNWPGVDFTEEPTP